MPFNSQKSAALLPSSGMQGLISQPGSRAEPSWTPKLGQVFLAPTAPRASGFAVTITSVSGPPPCVHHPKGGPHLSCSLLRPHNTQYKCAGNRQVMCLPPALRGLLGQGQSICLSFPWTSPLADKPLRMTITSYFPSTYYVPGTVLINR